MKENEGYVKKKKVKKMIINKVETMVRRKNLLRDPSIATYSQNIVKLRNRSAFTDKVY